jgi:hypothetical protein
MEGDHACAVVASGLGDSQDGVFSVFVGRNWVRLQEGTQIPIEEGAFNKFRLIVKDGEASLFLNEEKEPAATSMDPKKDSKSLLSFGDLSGFGGGNVDWKSVRWSDQEAVLP